MNSSIERLLALRVTDVMTRAVHTLSPNQTMEEAAATLSRFGLSGAPVVDEHGHCVGMLSATDFVRQLSEGGQTDDVVLPGPDQLLGQAATQPLDVDAASLQRVRRHMSADVRSISAEMTLVDAARLMCELHLHRLPVVDEKKHMLGLVSALDIVSALVKAIEE